MWYDDPITFLGVVFIALFTFFVFLQFYRQARR